MEIIVVGINHKTAPIEVREKFYCQESQRALLLSELKGSCSIAEAIVVSTCNRTEIYAHVLDAEADSREILRRLFAIKKISPRSSRKQFFYVLRQEEAIRHLLSVTAGLDSLVLGEKQIIGQMREAIAYSRDHGMLGTCFNVLSNLALRAGKKAQAETDISHGGMSVSRVAVAMAEKVLGTLKKKKLLLLGAGKMSELAGSALAERELEKIYVMNRTKRNALSLARKVQGEAVGFWDIKEVLGEVDVAICAVDAPHYILERETVEKAMAGRGNRELFLIDISIPRNIEPAIASMPQVTLVDLDDLDRVVQENRAKREAAVALVENIIAVKIQDFYSKMEKIHRSQSPHPEVYPVSQMRKGH